AGLLLKATSQADVRQWELLPRTTFVLPMRVPPGTHEVTVDFPDIGGSLRQTWRGIVAPTDGEAAYYIRMNRGSQGPFDWPPPPLAQPQQAGGMTDTLPPAPPTTDMPTTTPAPTTTP